MFKKTSVRSNRYFLAAELKRQVDCQASLGDQTTSLNTKCDMVVNSANHLCTKMKSLGSQAKRKLNSKIKTLINLAEAYSSTPKLRKKYKTSVVKSYRHFPAAELESVENDFVSHGDLGTDLYATCGMVVNSANHLCIKMKKLGCQAERKLNSKIQTQINLAISYTIALKLSKICKATAVRSYRHFLAAELKSQIVTMYTKCNMEVNSTNHLCPKVKSRGRQAKGKLNSKIQTQINLTKTYPITLKLTIYLQCNLRVLLIRIIKSAVATPGKKDFYDQVYHSKKGKLHKEIRRTKSQTYNVC